MNIHFSLSPDQMNYLRSSARIRQVTKRDLLCNLIGKILDDHLVLAVMDDADEYPAPLPKPGDCARERKRMILDRLEKGALRALCPQTYFVRLAPEVFQISNLGSIAAALFLMAAFSHLRWLSK